MTEEQVKELIATALADTKPNQDEVGAIIHFAQWLVRASYEEGWRAAGGDPTSSPHFEDASGWRLAWNDSTARGLLIRKGWITGQDSWR